MTNMSVRSGPAGNGALDLDIINEYLMEKSLPGPPPPPVEQNIQPVSSCPPSRSRRSGPVLVSRGAAPQAAYSFDQTPTTHCNNLTSMHPVRMNKASQKSGPRSSLPQYPQTGTEHLERFLEKPELVVVEQPKERGMRFRYECEGRSAGSILGASSTEVSKTLPAIEIQGPIDHIKKVMVIVSLVTKDIPYRPHPHCLVGKDCVDGICTVHINPQTSARHSFANLGIQCVRRKELDSSLQKRRNKKIDPFNTGHSKSIEDMDMNVVRLCFQCELEGKDGERVSLAPVVSNPIYDKKATTTAELKINRLNVIRGPCTGKTEIYMLCDKVQKDDIEIIFSLEDWEAKAEFAQTDVHRQIAIVFKSPPFREQKIVEEVEVSVCLRRISDRMDSEPVKFIYVPDNADPYGVKRKKRIKSAVAFSESCSASQSPDLVMNEPSTSQPFNSYVPEHSMPGVSTAVPDMETQRMDDIHYTDPYRNEDGCESLAPDTLEKIMSRIAQTLGPQSSEQLFREFYVDFEDTDMKSDLENIQPMMSMAGFNDAHFNQMVSENQGLGELEGIDGLVASYSVKSENNLDL